jgi:phage tail P2-like protein
VGLIRLITLTNVGGGYALAPIVTITGDGTGALAVAHLLGSSVGRIQILERGTGYTRASVSISTSPGDSGGGAAAIVSIGPTYEEHLLPYNATILEQCLSAVSDAIAKIPVPIEEIWRPYDCPEPLLPWLAWALSVDDWDNQWPESVRRQAIMDSIPHHKKKGTRIALDTAVAPYQSVFVFQEWWEYGGQAYHFRFKGTMPPATWPDLTNVNKMWNAAIRAKNVRSYPDPILIDAQTNPAPLYIVPFYNSKIIASNRPAAMTSAVVTTPVWLGGVVRVRTITRVGG